MTAQLARNSAQQQKLLADGKVAYGTHKDYSPLFIKSVATL
jgi:hypothetical protein